MCNRQWARAVGSPRFTYHVIHEHRLVSAERTADTRLFHEHTIAHNDWIRWIGAPPLYATGCPCEHVNNHSSLTSFSHIISLSYFLDFLPFSNLRSRWETAYKKKVSIIKTIYDENVRNSQNCMENEDTIENKCCPVQRKSLCRGKISWQHPHIVYFEYLSVAASEQFCEVK